jgi:hypothetical protein
VIVAKKQRKPFMVNWLIRQLTSNGSVKGKSQLASPLA